jgi:hypothetical protein
MRVPVIVIDRIGVIDRKLIRTELRRQIISAYEIEDRVIAVTGRIVAVRAFANRAAIIGVPRCRYLYVDGDEINQAANEPGQFKDVTKEKIHRFDGLDSSTARMLWDALMAAKIEGGIVENADGSRAVLAEYGAKEYDLVAEIVEGVLKTQGYQFVGANRGNGKTQTGADGGIRSGAGAARVGAGAGRESESATAGRRIGIARDAGGPAESPRVESVERDGVASDG